MALDYFYDEQIRRYLLQFVRMFSGFQYQTGRGADGTTTFRTVPATLASANRQVGHINRNNSENTLLSCPQISCWIKSISKVDDRRQAPNFVRQANVFERDFDSVTNEYTDKPGRKYTVESMMPVPYELNMQVDVWTSNELQKHQIMEQIMVLFNPAVDLQTGVNPIDWSSLTYVELDNIEWSNKSFPIGTEDEIEMASMTFKVPIWINAPSKLKRQSIIEQIVVNIGQLDKMTGELGEGYEWSSADLLARMIITPGNYRVNVSGNEVTLLSAAGTQHDSAGRPVAWADLLRQYGKFRDGVSQIRLKPSSNLDDTSQDLVGTLSLHSDPAKLHWTLDIESLKANTLPAVNRVVNPHDRFPGSGLPVAALGQRYLLVENDIAPNTTSWGNTNASVNDVIQYGSNGWQVVFDASLSPSPEYVLNSNSSEQYHWTGGMWQHSVEGEYNAGFWKLHL